MPLWALLVKHLCTQVSTVMSVSTTMLRYERGSTFTLPVQCALLHPRSCCAIVVITCKALVYTGVDSDVRVNDDAEV